MIFHASIPADHPEHVAAVMAEIWKGESFRFPPWPGAYVAMAGDDRSSTIEVYPRAHTIAPGEGDAPSRMQVDATPADFSCFHLAIATDRTAGEILSIGEREGWRAVRCSRGGFFEVIEFWIENKLLVEVMTTEMQRDYTSKVKPDIWRWTRQGAAAAAGTAHNGGDCTRTTP
jgi:hypothetical protein